MRGYDYSSAGAYFITICTHNRECLFGDIVDGEMRLNEWGRIVEWTWYDLPNHVANITLDIFVVMPNHFHGIIIITDTVVGAGSVGAGSVRAGSEPAPTPANTIQKRYGLPEIIRQFKTFSARRINEHRQTPGQPVWQRNYYEHIIRDDDDLNRIREYIINNPLKWESDEHYSK
ncbi:transposase [Thermoflavifilum thermophilum]|uniref:transposase n=1 Tax=Thermoflavifilum thermophilum TaxID=1393122 RepID=UPI001C9E2370|nr:transposase [Thermoflavifilum thermophilum]